MTLYHGTTGKIAVNATATSSHTEIFSGLAGNNPAWRLSIAGNEVTSVDDGYGILQFGFGMMNFISTSYDASIYSHRMQGSDDDTYVDLPGGVVAGGPAWMSGALDNMIAAEVRSFGGGTLYFQNQDVDNAAGLPYAAMVLAGSLDVQVSASNTLDMSTNTSTITLPTSASNSDLIIAHAAYSNIGNEYTPQIYNSINFIDLKRQKYQALAININPGTSKFSQVVQTRSVIFPQRILNSNSYDSHCSVISWGANGPVVQVDSLTTNSYGNHVRIPYTALKFGSGYGFQMGNILLGSTTAVKSVQTNSVSPEAIIGYATTCGTLDFMTPTNNESSQGFAFGLFSTNGGDTYAIANAAKSDNVQEYGRTSSLGFLIGIDGGTDLVLYSVRSPSVGSNGFSVQAVMSTNYPGVRMGYVAMGQSVNAPDHLMDANSASIFLADDSDYSDNLLLVGAAAPAITSSTLKAGYWSGQWLNASWVESFSNVGTPILSARFWPSISDFGTWDPGFPFGMQWFNGTTGRGLAGLWDLHPAGTSPTRRGWTTDSGDIYLVDPDNGNTFKGGLGSLDNNAINWQELDALGGGYDYQSIAITGSLSYETKIGDVVVTSDTQATVMSTAFKPDIVFIHMPHAGATNTRSEVYGEALGFSYGIWEARSGFGRFINGSIFNDMDGAGTDPMNTYIGSAMIYLGGSVDINVKYDVTSVGTGGFYIKTTTVNTLLSGNGASRPVYAALKFDDPTIQWKLVDFSLPSSSATQTISLGFAPKIAWTFGTNVKTLDYFEFPTSTAHRRNEGFFQGFWVESGGEGTHAGWIQALQTNQDTDHVHVQSGIGRLYAGASKVLQAEMNSVSVTGSTNLSYYAKINSVGPDLAPNDAKGFMLVIGVNENLGVGSSGPDFKIGSCYYAVMSNPGYEEGNLNGWTVIGNTTASSFASLTGKEGNYFAIAGTSGQTAIWYQDYDIPNSFGVSSGNLMVSLSALFSDAAASGEDHGHMQIAFLNSSSQLMAATATKTDSSGFRGLTNTADSTDMVPVPPGTTKVRVGFSAGDGTGDTQLSFYVDTTTMVFCVGSKWYRQATPNNGHFADLAITGWTQKTGTTLAFSGGVIQSDWRANGIVPSYTYGSGLNSAEIAQGVDIASYGNLYQQIDAGSAYFELRYFLSGVAADGGRVGVRFMNAGSTVLGSYSLISTTAFPSIITSVVCATTTIPASTRIIGYHIHHDTGGAGNIDYYPTALNGVIVVNSPFDAAVASTPSSSGPAAGGALFRSQPVTDNRDFPTPLTNVRAFPSD